MGITVLLWVFPIVETGKGISIFQNRCETTDIDSKVKDKQTML